MEKEITGLKDKYEIVAVGANGSRIVCPIRKGRSLVGRGHACDIVVPFPDVSSIHAVIEMVGNGQFKIYDLNSRNGTIVDGQKVVVENLGLDQEFQLGDNKIKLQRFKQEDMMPPPLGILDDMPPVVARPLPGRPSSPASRPSPPSDPSHDSPSLPSEAPEQAVTDEEVPRVKYPLAKDPKAEFSEYIFEDVEHLYPIFKYDINQSAVEVIIVFNDRIQSVDYLPQKNATYSLVGGQAKSKEIEYPYLSKNENYPFVKYINTEAEIFPLPGYKAEIVGDQNKEVGAAILLLDDEILQLSNQHIQIFVRKTQSPPVVDHAPVLRRDSDFKKYLLLMLFLVSSFLVPFTLFEVDEEIEEDKAPERIATILYKRKLTVSKSKAIDKTKKAPKRVQKSPKQDRKKPKISKNKKQQNKTKTKTATSKSGEKSAKKVGKVKKASPNKGPKNVKKNRVRPVKAKTAGGSGNRSRRSKVATAVTNSKGSVDTYKSADFKSTVSNLISKGGSTKAAKAASSSSVGYQGSSISEANNGATLKTAKVSNNTGSLSGVASGKLDSSKGVEGLVDKKSIYTAGTPYKTVVLGGLDPDVIRQILVDNIPKFRYCYQKVLDRSKAAFNGIVRLNFIIGASGHVSKAGVDSVSGLPSNVKGCVVNILRRIRFPEPAGGGVVEVNQPMNFYPRMK